MSTAADLLLVVSRQGLSDGRRQNRQLPDSFISSSYNATSQCFHALLGYLLLSDAENRQGC